MLGTSVSSASCMAWSFLGSVAGFGNGELMEKGPLISDFPMKTLLMRIFHCQMVGGWAYPSKKKISQLGWWNSQTIWKRKKWSKPTARKKMQGKHGFKHMGCPWNYTHWDTITLDSWASKPLQNSMVHIETAACQPRIEIHHGLSTRRVHQDWHDMLLDQTKCFGASRLPMGFLASCLAPYLGVWCLV